MTGLDERICVCALNTIFGFKPQIPLSLMRTFGSASAVFGLDREALRDIFGPYNTDADMIRPSALDKAADELEKIRRFGARFITIDDPSYPQALKSCPDPPVGLYFKGTDPPEKVFGEGPFISIVGTRDQTPYGKEMCIRTVQALSKSSSPPAIVSGLALGVDVTAHSAALSCGLPTIAVIPTGIDMVYPSQHTYIADRIVSAQGSALITDYPTDTPPLRPHFLRRNRIIAGLSRCTVLIESKIKGGGMMTARLAWSYDRDVFALPGRIDDVHSQGCNVLIRQKTAEALVEFPDFVKSIGLGKATLTEATDIEACIDSLPEALRPVDKITHMKKIASCIRSNRGISVQEICERTGMEYALVSSLTGILRTAGIIDMDLLHRCSINLKNT